MLGKLKNRFLSISNLKSISFRSKGDLLPTSPTRENWLPHKGMIEAAVYIQTELAKNKIIERALNFNLEKKTQSYTIVLVGHR